MIGQRNRAIQRPLRGQFFTGLPWLYIIGLPLLIGAAYWYYTASNVIPACASEATRKTLDRSILKQMITTRVANGNYPRLSAWREVGYNKVRAIRGCAAQLKIGDESLPFSYIIERNPDRQRGGTLLRGANPAIVAARFGTIGADGDFQQNAEPIGRENLEQAMRTGLTALGNKVMNAPMQAMKLKMYGLSWPDKNAAPTRENDIEPTGTCRALPSGKGYICPLLAEWDSPIIALQGGSVRRMMRGDFTFEPGPAGATLAWRVSARFEDEFNRANLAGLIKKPPPETANAPAIK